MKSLSGDFIEEISSVLSIDDQLINLERVAECYIINEENSVKLTEEKNGRRLEVIGFINVYRVGNGRTVIVNEGVYFLS